MKALSEHSFLARLLGKLARAVIRHPRWFFWPQILFLCVCIGYTAKFLTVDQNQDNLVSSQKRYQHNLLEFRKEFPQQSDLVVVVESENIEKNRQFVERLGARMEAETNLFQDIFYWKGLSMGGDKALMLASQGDVSQLAAVLRENLPFVQKFSGATNLVSLFNLVNTQFRTAKREQSEANDSLVKSVSALGRILQQARESLERSGPPPPPDIMSLFDAGHQATEGTYITFNRGKIFLVTAHAPADELNNPAIDELQRLINITKSEVPGVNAGLTGEPVLDYAQTVQSERDTLLASVISLVLCALIFIYGYNETGRPIKATICLLFGLAYSLAWATLAIGHLNILTITFLPMLIGLAIDFGVHLITRYEEELRHGKTKEDAMIKAMAFTGQGIFMGALTTAGAFLAMGFTEFQGIREMGIICGGGLMIALVPMLTLLPVLLLRGRQNAMEHQTNEDDRRARIENTWLQRPGIVTLVILAVSVLAIFQIKKVDFDYNLLNLQSANLPAVAYINKLNKFADKSLLFCEVEADNLDEALAYEKKIRALTNEVQDVESAAGYLHQEQGGKMELISQIKQLIAPLQFAAPDEKPVDIYALSQTLYSFYGYLGAARAEIGNSDPELAREFLSLQNVGQDFRKAMLAGDDETLAAHAEQLAAFQQGFFNQLRDTFSTLREQDARMKLNAQDLPPVIRHRFIGVHGKFVIQVFPKKDVWQRENQKEFVLALRHALDPDDTNHPIITGTPVQMYEYTSVLKDSYLTAAWYALAAIALIVLIHFRSLLAVLLALIPVGIGMLWLVGLMGWLRWPFNPANIMTLPLVIGIGVTNGIHILNRFAEERTPGILSRSTGKAVLVSGLTAIAGFGSLILAKHRGIHSLGVIMSIGIATCMIAGLTFVPALLNLIGRRRPLIQKPSVSNATPTPGLEEPR